MSATLQPGQHLLSAAITTASRLAAKTGELPRLKTVAKELGVDKELLKQVIFDREHLLVVMTDVALQRLLHTITQEMARCSSPVDQLEAIIVAYVDWALLYPQEFRLVGEMPAALFEAGSYLDWEGRVRPFVAARTRATPAASSARRCEKRLRAASSRSPAGRKGMP